MEDFLFENITYYIISRESEIVINNVLRNYNLFNTDDSLFDLTEKEIKFSLERLYGCKNSIDFQIPFIYFTDMRVSDESKIIIRKEICDLNLYKYKDLFSLVNLSEYDLSKIRKGNLIIYEDDMYLSGKKLNSLQVGVLFTVCFINDNKEEYYDTQKLFEYYYKKELEKFVGFKIKEKLCK